MAEVNPGERTESSRSAHRQSAGRVCIVGVGTVGLHEVLAFDAAGYETLGYDADSDVISAYQRGRDPTGTVEDERIAQCECEFTSDPSAIGAAEYVHVAVPTATDEGNASLEAVAEVGTTIGKQLDRGTTVVLVSTVSPGATERVFVPAVESDSGMTAGEGFSIAHAPVRLSPSTEGPTVFPETRLVGAESATVADDVAALFEQTVESVHVVEEIRAVEAAKCIENVQRDVNIALVNELTRVLGEMGLEPRTVLEAAGTKWNFHGYEPGLVGGECVPVAPHFLMDSAERAGCTPQLVDTARSVNEHMSSRVVDATIAALDRRGQRVRDAGRSPSRDRPQLVVVGLSYKPDSGSLKATPSEPIIRQLQQHGVDVVGHDPLVDADAASERLGIEMVGADEMSTVDAALVLVDHAKFTSLTLDDLSETMGPHAVVVDVPGVFDHSAADTTLIYRGLGDVS